jgi:DNA-directed RNA polymerase subunit RPC12/RpoP
MLVTYKCSECNLIFEKQVNTPTIETECIHCGKKALKTFKGLSMEKEDDTVSHAIEMMKYATNPSGKQKTII